VQWCQEPASQSERPQLTCLVAGQVSNYAELPSHSATEDTKAAMVLFAALDTA